MTGTSTDQRKDQRGREQPRAHPFDADTIVVGSGFGGSVAACRLAQAGFDVLVLERGRRYGPEDFPAMPPDSALLPDFHRWTWNHDQGLWDIRDLEDLISVQAAGYGGGSLIYANVHLRAPDSVFKDKRWPDWYRTPGNLTPYYDLAASMLDVAPISLHTSLYPALVKADQLKRAAQHLKRYDAYFLPPLAISRAPGKNAHQREQAACIGCGGCSSGCPVAAKNTLDYNYLAVAEDHGARTVTLCEVTKIEQLGSNDWLLHCYDHAADQRCSYRAKYVFLCAGSVRSTELLARARLLKSAKPIKDLVGVGYFPGGDALGMVYDTTQKQQPSFGPTITSTLVHNDPEDEGSFFLIQDGGYLPQLERLAGVLRASVWLGRNRITTPRPAAVAPSLPQLRALEQLDRSPLPLTAASSAVDDILAARAAGDFDSVLSEELRDAWTGFVTELQGPLLLRAVVDRTISSAIRERYKKSWLTRRCDPEKLPLRTLIGLTEWCVRWFVRMTFGGIDVLTSRAMYALLGAGGLPREQVASQVLGYSGHGAAHRTMLLAMGRDAATGTLDIREGKLMADLKLFKLAPGYSREELLMTDIAKALGGELRTNPAWAFLGKPITVHNQGGCVMSEHADDGVTTPEGRVRGCDGLYICDASLFCTSVGVNPSATILAIAERNVLEFIRSEKSRLWPAGDASPGAQSYRRHVQAADAWAKTRPDMWAKTDPPWQLTPPSATGVSFESASLGLSFCETMQGYYHPELATPPTAEADNDSAYRALETKGRPDFPVELKLDLNVENLASFFEDEHHVLSAAGSITLRLPSEPAPQTRILVHGSTLELFVKHAKPYEIRGRAMRRRRAQARIAGTNPSKRKRRRLPEQRFLSYYLKFLDDAQQVWWLCGYKRIRDDPGPDSWRASTTLYVTLLGPTIGGGLDQGNLVARGGGVLHVDLGRFLHEQLPSVRIGERRPAMQVHGTKDPARIVWATATFASFFFGSLQRIYLPGTLSTLDAVLRPPHRKIRR